MIEMATLFFVNNSARAEHKYHMKAVVTQKTDGQEHIYIHTHIYSGFGINVCICIHICIYMCICVYMYTHIYV